MKKIMSLLLYVILGFTACNSNGSSEPEPIVKDSVHENPADSFNYNPAMPPVQNSDDPDRFSQ